MTIGKKLRLFGIAALTAVIAICGVLLNSYLSDNNLFIYATGTDDKAFLNATWKMSPRELERINNTTLSPADSILLLFTPEILNPDRFKALVQKDVFLWGYRAKVQYTFFDNMLYEYYVPLTTSDPNKPHNEILETLRGQFGDGNKDDEKRADLVYNFKWETEKQTISYWMGKNEGQESYYIGIRAVHKPFYEQIEEVANNEKKRYF